MSLPASKAQKKAANTGEGHALLLAARAAEDGLDAILTNPAYLQFWSDDQRTTFETARREAHILRGQIVVAQGE